MRINGIFRSVLVALAALGAAQDSAVSDTADPRQRPTTAQGDLAPDSFVKSLSIPTIALPGINLTGERLKAILNSGARGLRGMKAINAKRISVPEITISFAAPGDGVGQGGSPGLSLTNIVLEDIRAGRAAIVTIERITLGMRTGGAYLANVVMRDVSMEALLTLYDGSGPGDAARASDIAAKTTVAGGKITSQDVNCTIGAIAVGAMKLRPNSTPSRAFAALMSDLDQARNSAAIAQLAWLLSAYQSVVAGFEADEGRLQDLHCEARISGTPEMTVDVKGMTTGPIRGGVNSALAMDSLSVRFAGEPRGSMRKVVLKPIDLMGSINALKAAPKEFNFHSLTADLRSAIPAIESLSFEDAVFFIPLPADRGGRQKLEILSFDAKFANYRSAIPTSVEIDSFGISFAIPQGVSLPGVAALREVGLTGINGTARAAFIWNENDETISIRELSLTGRELGGVFVSGEIVNVGKALFSADPHEALAVVPDLAVKFVTVSAIDSGLGDLIAQYVARLQGSDPAAVREVLAEVVRAMVSSTLAASPSVAAISDAVGSFASGSRKNLNITIQAHGTGLDMNDLSDIARAYPALLGRVRIDAEAK